MHNTMYLPRQFSEEIRQTVSRLCVALNVPINDMAFGHSFGNDFIADRYKTFSTEEDYSFRVAALLLLTQRSQSYTNRRCMLGNTRSNNGFLVMSAWVKAIPTYSPGFPDDPKAFDFENMGEILSARDKHYGLKVVRLCDEDWKSLRQYDGDPDKYLKQTGQFGLYYVRAEKDTIRLKDLEAFIKQQTGEELYIVQLESDRVDVHSTVIFMPDDIEHRQPKVLHALTSCLPRLYPWLFEDEPVTDEEEELLHSLLSDNREEFIAKAEILSDKLNLLNWWTRLMIAGNLRCHNETDLRNAEERMIVCENAIANCRQSLKGHYATLNGARLLYETLKKSSECSAEDPKVIEIADYIETNKAVRFINAGPNNKDLTFVITTPLNNFDPDALEACIDNCDSFVYETIDFADADMLEEEAIRLLQAIINDEVQVMMSGEFRIDTKCDWRYMHASVLTDLYAMYNPHLEHYTCFGGYEEDLDDACFDGDIVRFLSTCVASMGSLNTTEAPTMEHFIRDLFTRPSDPDDNSEYGERVPNTQPVIRFPDGQMCSPVEAVRRLMD